jgi:hypothetical protein
VNKIYGKNFTTCRVAADGDEISLGFADVSGKLLEFRMPTDQLALLAMTLPSLLDEALQLQFLDKSLRYSYPLAEWRLECSSVKDRILMTLVTVDGFSVCFSLGKIERMMLGKALAEPPDPTSQALN